MAKSVSRRQTRALQFPHCHLDLRWLVSLWNVNLNVIREPAKGLVGVWGRVWGWQGPGNVPVDLKGHPEALKFYAEGGATQQSY